MLSFFFLLPGRYSLVVTRRRALCAVLLCWVGSVLSSFAQFIGTDVLHTWTNGRTDPGADDHGLDGNWTTSVPHHTTTPLPKYHQGRKVIAKYLPYGGFLSKFYVEDKHNFTYAEIHSSHWGVCAPDTVLSPQFVVYVHGITIFILPLLFLIVIYFVLLCTKLKKALINHDETIKHKSHLVHFIAFSICLLVLLCLPLYVIEALLLFTPDTHLPPWTCAVALFFFQLYSLVPPILFTPPRRQSGDEQVSLPLAVPNLTAAVVRSKGKSIRMALREVVQSAPWSSAKHSLKAKVCPEV